MRIALFSDTFLPVVNGVANTVYRSAQRFSELGHAVSVCTVSHVSARELSAMAGHNITVYTLPSMNALVYKEARFTFPVGLAKRHMREFKPDVIHTHIPLSVGIEAIWSAEALGVPLVGTHHTFYDHYLKYLWLDYRWARNLSWTSTVWYYNKCDVVISPTLSLAEGLTTHGLKKTPVIVPNPVDTDVFRPAASPATREQLRSALGLRGAALVYMGRVSYEKSIDQVIRALALLVKDKPDSTLLIIGDGPEREKLTALALTLGLSDRVVFTGYLFGRKLVEALQASDLFLLGSKSENMPLAVLEAMAAGLPVIAVSSLGMNEIIRDRENGFLLPPDHPEDMAAKVVELMDDAPRRAAFGRKSRELSALYSDVASAARLVEIYTEAIAQHP